MGERITQKDLEAVCARINRTVNGTDETPAWIRNADEDDNRHFHQAPDVYVISYAYGGAALHRNCALDAIRESHGVHDVLSSGHVPKRELYDRMQAFLRGIDVTTERGIRVS